MKKIKLIALIALALVTFSCKKEKEEVATQLDKNIAATVYGSAIKMVELNLEVARFKKGFLTDGAELTEEEELKIKKQVLNSLIRKKIYTMEMDKLDIKADREMAKKQYTNLLMQYGSRDAVDMVLAESGFTMDQIMMEFEFQTRVNKLSKYIHDLDITIAEEEIEKYYQEHKDTVFVVNGSATARHILIKTEEGEDKALEKIKNIKQKIDGGLSFEDAAIKYSQGPTGENGGLLGEFKKGQMVKEFEEVAFTQEVGVISEPVLTKFGYHLILIESRVEDSIAPIEKAKPFIINTLKKDNYYKNLEENAEVIKAQWANEEI